MRVQFAYLSYKAGEIVSVGIDARPKTSQRSSTESALIVGVTGDAVAGQVACGDGKRITVIIETMDTNNHGLKRFVLRQP